MEPSTSKKRHASETMASDSKKKPTSCDSGLPCFVCLSVKTDKNKKYKPIPPKPVDDVGKVKTQYSNWMKKVDCPSNILPAFTSLPEAFASSDNPSLVWHIKDCRPNFMSEISLSLYTDKKTDHDDNVENEDLNLSTRVLRSHMPEYKKDLHCVICCSGTESGPCTRLYHLILMKSWRKQPTETNS